VASEPKCTSSRRFLGCDSSGVEQRHRHDDAEDEAADVREERHAASARRRRREAGVPFDEPEDEPAAEVDQAGILTKKTSTSVRMCALG
jgi:hypothetical protein